MTTFSGVSSTTRDEVIDCIAGLGHDRLALGGIGIIEADDLLLQAGMTLERRTLPAATGQCYRQHHGHMS